MPEANSISDIRSGYECDIDCLLKRFVQRSSTKMMAEVMVKVRKIALRYAGYRVMSPRFKCPMSP